MLNLVRFAILAVMSAQGGGFGSISGSVHTNGGKGISSAIVIISQPGGRMQRLTRTNADGGYTFSGVPAGSYIVQGCDEQSGPSMPVDVELKAGVELTQDLTIDTVFAKTAEPACGADSTPASHEYAGAAMSFDSNADNADLRAFFRSIGSLSGLQVEIDPSIKRTAAVHLRNIPWDLALDVVLKTLGLGGERNGNVLRIAVANPALGQDRVLMGTVTIEGELTGFTLQNPRALLQVKAPNAAGALQVWPVEWESADYLNENGIRAGTFGSGDQLIVTGTLTRNGTIRLIGVQRPSDGFSWGYLPSIRSAPSEGAMFVSATAQ